MNIPLEFDIVGSMSGTSLDGVDLAFCRFEYSDDNWSFRLIEAETIPYPEAWKVKLRNSIQLSGFGLFQLDHEYGRYLGNIISDFIQRNKIKPQFIASHGHTVFHEPDRIGSLQIGNGHEIYALTGIPVVADFRSLDISLGGQGAPLVPVGDKFLFPEYQYCLNLGGFSNISYLNEDILIAYDICPLNIVLNHFANLYGNEFDIDGELGRRGKINPELLCELNSLEYYKKLPPKSLGVEFLHQEIFPITKKYLYTPEDFLATFYEHFSRQISAVLNNNPNFNVLVTGGGAKNKYLIENIQKKTNNILTLPSQLIIDFKEALIFAFLGALRINGSVNCLASVTGARRDSCGGIIYGL